MSGETQPLLGRGSPPPTGRSSKQGSTFDPESRESGVSDSEEEKEKRGPWWLPARAGRAAGQRRSHSGNPFGAIPHDQVENLQSAAGLAKRWAKLKQGKPKARRQVTYNPRILLTWTILGYVKGTVLDDLGILQNIFALTFVALVSGFSCYHLVPDPKSLDAGTFFAIVLYIKVFIAFMLGMFLTNCLTRWWDTVVSLTDFFLVVRKLTWLANTMQVSVETRNVIQRYAVMSCLLLEAEVSSLYEPPEIIADRWDKCKRFLRHEALASAEEIERLEKECDRTDRAIAVWAWIGVHIGTLKVPPPVLTLCASTGVEAIMRIKEIKTSVQLQMPLMYTHMLALLVHLNNFLLAVATGVAIAVSVHHALHAFGPDGEIGEEPDRPGKLYRAIQAVFVSLLSLLIQPVIYHAFLQIGAILADPFTHEAHGLPLLDYTSQLRGQIRELNELADQDIEWLMDNTYTGDFSKQTFHKVVQLAIDAELTPRGPETPLVSPRREIPP